MKRRLLNLLTALSLLVWVAGVAAWVRSQFVSDSGFCSGPVDPGHYVHDWFLVYTGNVRVAADSRYTDSPSERAAAAAGGGAGGSFWRTATWSAISSPYANPWSERMAWNFTLPHAYRYRAMRTNVPGGGSVWEDRWTVEVPFWCLAIAFALPPAAWAFRHCRGRRRKRLGLCPACAYDLRATPGRCPECGNAVAVRVPCRIMNG
jgi:hypothetical protein